MKSIKKRFKAVLAEVECEAAHLLLLAEDLPMLEPVFDHADTAIQACRELGAQAKLLGKAEFSALIFNQPALLVLDELVDSDVISAVERRFAAELMPGYGADIAADFILRFLQKLEKRLGLMNARIQQLGELLSEGG